MTNLRHLLLRFIYDLQPFNLKGDAKITSQGSLPISCIIPTFDRWKELDTILSCLALQNLSKEHFEVVVVEDGATDEVRNCCKKYEQALDIQLIHTENVNHCIGALRNRALEQSRGDLLLFLDDDTQIYQTDFLQLLTDNFISNPDIDCVQISGRADRCFIKGRYGYLDKFSFAARCVAYRRGKIADIGGFVDALKSYEDIELSIRFILSGGEIFPNGNLVYFHPPLYFKSYDKTITNGLAFLSLFHRYTFILWIVCYLNALRFLPLLLSPSIKHRQWGNISAGFVIAPIYKLFKRIDFFYR